MLFAVVRMSARMGTAPICACCDAACASIMIASVDMRADAVVVHIAPVGVCCDAFCACAASVGACCDVAYARTVFVRALCAALNEPSVLSPPALLLKCGATTDSGTYSEVPSRTAKTWKS
jgi:hypothetical protein